MLHAGTGAVAHNWSSGTQLEQWRTTAVVPHKAPRQDAPARASTLGQALWGKHFGPALWASMHRATGGRPGEAVHGRDAVARVKGEKAQGEVLESLVFQVRAVCHHLPSVFGSVFTVEG